MKNPHLSIVIPVYKAEKSINELYNRLVEAIEPLTSDFEILMIEDCGGDESWKIVETLASKDSRVRGIQFSRNFGQHFGITAGLDHSRGDWVIVMDCDLQDRPEEIPALYQKAQEGFDVVLALRGKRKDPIIKRIFSYIFYKFFSYLADIEYTGDSGNFRIMSRKVVLNFCKMREHSRFFGGLMQWMGFPTATIKVKHSERFEGKSTYTFSKLWILAADTIIAYSDKPLRISIRIGFLMSFFSIFYGSYILINAILYDSKVPGWNSLIVTLFFIGGIIIYILGIIGIYLGKTFDETKGRPLYIINRLTFTEKFIEKNEPT